MKLILNSAHESYFSHGLDFDTYSHALCKVNLWVTVFALSPAVFQFRTPINLCRAWRQSQDAVSTRKRIMLLGWCSLLWEERRGWAPPSLVTEKFAPLIYQVLSGHWGAGNSQGHLLLGGASVQYVRFRPRVGWRKTADVLNAAKFDGFVVVICFGSVPRNKTKRIINAFVPRGTFMGWG